MFVKLYNHITGSFLLLSILLSVLLVCLGFAVIADNLFGFYSATAQNKVKRAVSNCSIYMDSIAASCADAVADRDIIDRLNGNGNANVSAKLDYLCGYSVRIDGAVIYGMNGEVFTSSRISGVPSYDELSAATKTDWLDGDLQQYISFRNTAVIGYFGSNPYPEEMGTVSFIKQIRDGDRTVGIIVADINPSVLYEKFVSEADQGYFRNAKPFMVFDEGYFPYEGNSSLDGYIAETDKSLPSRDLKTLIVNSPFITPDCRIVYVSPLDDFYDSLLYIALLLCECAAVLVLFASLFADSSARSVTRRLDALSRKMEKQKL